MTYARITDSAIDPQAELGSFLERIRVDGAVVSFVGIARPATRSGAAVEGIFLDHHPALSLASVREITAAATEGFEISAASVVHRYGEVRPGETIVFVATASAHRRAAFEAADYLMDRLKTDAVFWKREDAADGSRWIEPTDDDRADRERWSQ